MIKAFLQTIWASALAISWWKWIIIIVVIGIITRFNKILGTLAAILLIAYLANWIG